jgi:RHS repeat-associated protein
LNGSTLLNNITYRPFSQTAMSWRWGNGSSYSRSFDADGRVTAVTLGPVQRSYAYDAAGRIVSQTDVGPQGTKTTSYGYDEAGQLTSYSGPSGSANYTYDTNGNRLSAKLSLGLQTYTYAQGSNRLTSVSSNTSFAYNSDGSPSTYGDIKLTYGDFGRLGRITSADGSGPVVDFFYNGQGQRVVKSSRVWIASGGGTAAAVSPFAASTTASAQTSDSTTQSTGFWQQTRTVWFNGQPVAAVIGGVVYNVHADHLGTPRSLTRASDNVEVWRWDSDPFGMSGPSSPTPGVGVTYNLRLPGQIKHSESSLVYNGMRDYDPGTGRYIEADPMGLGAGLARYTYVGGNPLSRTDPSGLIWPWLVRVYTWYRETVPWQARAVSATSEVVNAATKAADYGVDPLYPSAGGDFGGGGATGRWSDGPSPALSASKQHEDGDELVKEVVQHVMVEASLEKSCKKP